jgi:hypothetical protein
LSGVQGIFGGFEHLPLPIRGSVEALVAFAAVAVPLSKLRDVLGSINTLAGTRAAVVAPAATGATGAAAGQGEVSAANASEGESATRAAGQTGALNAQLQKTASVAPQAASGMIEVDGALATVGETSASVLSELNALETSLVAMGFAPEKVAAALAQTRQEMLGLETPIAEVNAELAVTEAQIEGMIAQLGALAPVAAETGVALAGVATKASTLGTVSGAGLQSLDATLIKAGIDADVLALAMARVSGAEVEATASTVELMTTEELLTERARLLAKAQEEAGLSIRGFLGSFSGVAGFLGGAFIANSILDQIGNHSPDVTRLGKSIEVFGKTGEASGTLKDALNDLDPRILKINSDLSDLQKVPGINLPGVKQLFSVGEKGGLALTGQIGASNTAKATLKELDDEMARLTDSGNIQDANALFQLLSSTMGGTFEDFPKFKQALDDFTASQEAMANGTADANTILAQQASVFEDLATKFELQKGLDSVSAAQKQVRDDYADIAGTSAKAKEADRAEASAKHALADANRGVVDAQQSLSDSYVRVSDAQEKVGDSSRRLADA